MKKLTIFEVYVLMTSQEQCDRMKQVCVDNKLKNPFKFKFDDDTDYFSYWEEEELFGIFYDYTLENDLIKVTESEFLQLLKEYKDGNK